MKNTYNIIIHNIKSAEFKNTYIEFMAEVILNKLEKSNLDSKSKIEVVERLISKLNEKKQ